MTDDSARHHRRSIRLKGYDYTQAGAYFVTLVTAGREYIFGEIKDNEMVLNNIGQLVSILWQALPIHFPIALGYWVVMPNHLHGIIILRPVDLGILDQTANVHVRGEAGRLEIICEPNISLPPASPLRAASQNSRPHGTACGSLAAVVQNFKSLTTRRVNALRNTPAAPLWQRNYFEHIIRSDDEWDQISRYIHSNPLRWAEDVENPVGARGVSHE